MTTLAWILLSCVAGGALSLGIAALVAFRVKARWISTLVSFAVGALLGAVFLDILPHLFEHNPHPGATAGMLLAGILVFFVLEKVLLWRHHHHHGGDDESEHGHGEHDHGRSGWMIVFGDSFHNFTDGVIIAGAFLADVRLGITTSLAIIAHEIPQEIGDFLILLHSGFGKQKALLLNALSSFATVVGALLGYVMLKDAQEWVPTLLALAAASMIYVAVADLIPGLHRKSALRETVMQVVFILLGVGLIAAIHELAGH
ncbi:ZIP zinc transporter [Betaproteobacteria bacterium GR16-43]|nr:ZIP zinc transporter [Betaproteobacteria bacterium GR16-43]